MIDRIPTRRAPSPRPGADSRDGNGQLRQPSGQLRVALAALIIVGLPAPATAQQAPTLHDRAIAAGYKALTLCSAIFDAALVGGVRGHDSVEANELKGIYPEYDALIAALPAEISGEDSKLYVEEHGVLGPAIRYDDPRVTVRYDAAMPPRVAIAGTEGCTVLPVGTDPAKLRPITLSHYGSASADWPAGDRKAVARPRGDAAKLAAAVVRAFDSSGYGTGTNTVATLVVQDGRIVSEHYAEGFDAEVPTRTWSVAKSISGTLIGVAVHKGWLDPSAPVPIPEWQKPGDPRAAITLDNLMRMASGLHSDTAGNRTDAIYFGGTAVTEETVTWPMEVQPGSRFRYANNDILLAVHALAGKANDELFPRHLLLGRIGMNHTIAERDWQGNYILSSQVWSTARDLARLGMFWLADGVWQGERILPEGWVEYMTTPSGPQPASGPGYGATMWLFGPAQGLPEGSYAAQGNRGQFVMVIPSRHLVIVRRGEDPGAARFDIAKFTADVLEALQ